VLFTCTRKIIIFSSVSFTDSVLLMFLNFLQTFSILIGYLTVFGSSQWGFLYSLEFSSASVHVLIIHVASAPADGVTNVAMCVVLVNSLLLTSPFLLQETSSIRTPVQVPHLYQVCIHPLLVAFLFQQTSIIIVHAIN
jgi:hypothetical protein